MAGHRCHAPACDVEVPPRLHMCAGDWRLVPRPLQRALLDAYEPGQERSMSPSPAYLRAAEACVRANGAARGLDQAVIDRAATGYEAWAKMLEDEDA